MAPTLVINPGSSSRKYALYHNGNCVLELRFENTNTGYEMCTQTVGIHQVCHAISRTDFSEAFTRITDAVNTYLFSQSAGTKLDTVVVRVVAPGTFFQKHAVIDDAYVAALQERSASAPLHIPIIIREIESAKKNFHNAKLIAASDSAFHATLPPEAREFSIPSAEAKNLDIYRFGYHGLSIASIVRRIHPLIGRDPERMIVCHIGNGTSVTAIKNGKSVETTMGFSPSTGLPMGSRAGDIDPAALLELMRVKHWRPADAQVYLNTNGGLAGMANQSDIRQLLDMRSHNNPEAIKALNIFAYHIKKAIAAQTVALGGLDVLVLTATAAVRSVELRELVLSGLTYLGINISEERNNVLIGKDGTISTHNSPVKVVVMKTDEMGEMALVGQLLTHNAGKYK